MAETRLVKVLPFSLNLAPLKEMPVPRELSSKGIVPGLTATDVLLRVNPPGSVVPTNIKGRFANRDAVHKKKFGVLTPFVISDPYVFSVNWKSDVSNQKKFIVALIETLTQKWKSYGLPTKIHKTIGLEVPDDDFESFVGIIMKQGGLTQRQYDEMVFILTNMDILPKFSYQRYVTPGWYTHSYQAKTKPVSSEAKLVLEAIMKGRKRLATTDKGKMSIKEVIEGNFDPLGTNVGYPLYYAEMSDGIDTAKIKLATLYKGVFSGSDPLTNGIWYDIKNRVARRSAELGLDPDGYLFASAVSRRFKVGNKPIPSYSSGQIPELEGFVSGASEPRIVFMFSNMFNVILAPIMPVLKGTRKLKFGGYSDNIGTARLLKRIKEAHQANVKSTPSGPFLTHLTLENDASQFDRNISLAHTDYHAELVQKYLVHPKHTGVVDMLKHIRRTPILVPDINNQDQESHTMAFTGTSVLPSGTKPTGEIGSDMTDWMCSLAYYRLGYYTLADIENIAAGEDPPHGKPFFSFLGDDNTHHNIPVQDLARFNDQIKLAYEEFGITPGILFGDRFLMRHSRRGKSEPVLARIIQQRISNENIPKHHVIYSMGVIAAMDNLFSDFSLQLPEELGVAFTPRGDEPDFILDVKKTVCKWLISTWDNASIKPLHAIRFVHALLKGDKDECKAIRKEVESLLPKVMQTLSSRPDYDQVNDDYIISLLKDKDSPSSQALINALAEAQGTGIDELITKADIRAKKLYDYQRQLFGITIQDFSV